MEREFVGKNELMWISEGPGAHQSGRISPESVRESLVGKFRFEGDETKNQGLRTPQLGALHAILSHRTMETVEPITVVMPTGTGKTDTMIAAFCQSPRTTLIVVPSDALREQIANSFATLGVLPKVGVLTDSYFAPVVLLLKGGIASASEVIEAIDKANVVVTTAQALLQCSEEALVQIADRCDRLFVDEAHHVAARTWRSVAELFKGKEVIQFTATPYREDGQHLGGRIAYAYPLRLAQKNNYFARINYHSVVDLAAPDRAVAKAAIRQLREDLDGQLDHLLMARVSSVKRAKEIVKIYEELAPDLEPVRIDTGVTNSAQAQRLDDLFNRRSRIVVCVNMLGEGFDLPALKIAAIHDPQKSLAVTLQFIGRFTRASGGKLGEASAFVPLQVTGIDDRLRKLYGEDADWNDVIRDLTEREVGREKQRSEFEIGFGSLPIEVAMRSVHPKMSTVTYRSDEAIGWDPETIYELFEDRLLTTQLGINNKDKVVWWVTREKSPVRWGEFASFNELVHHLYVVHVDSDSGFLYVNSTNNATMHEDVAKAIGGAGTKLVNGDTVYRILSKVSRRVPTNVGLLDAVSRTRRFSMHVGQDVLAAWRGEGGTKMKTNIFAHGFEDKRAVSFGASRKGRVWSHQEAADLHDWVAWAREVGPVITDESISLDTVMSGFLLPEAATERPPHVPLTIEWPYELVATISQTRRLKYAGQDFSLLEAELRLRDHSPDGPLRFEVVTPGWSLEFEVLFNLEEPPQIRPVGDDGMAETDKETQSLSQFLQYHGVLITFEDEIVLLESGLLLRPSRERRLFPREDIETGDWAGIDIKRESQGPERNPSTVQFRTVEILCGEKDWEIVIDDDGPGELADLVLMKRSGDDLEIVFAHCKYSSKRTPGARIEDLYDVCGQAMKMNRAKSLPELLTSRILRRETNRQARGETGLVVGDSQVLHTIVGESRYRSLKSSVVIVQPGMSKALVSDDMRALLGGTDRFLTETYGMQLRVIGSQ